MASILDDVLQQTVGPLFRAGNLIPDAVEVNIGNKTYDGWSAVSIHRDLNAMTSSFSINVADKWRQSNEKWPFQPGEQLLVKTSGQVVINGYIDRLDVSVSNEDRQISISGRDKTGDLVDSAAIGLRSSYSNISIVEIAKIYAQDFGITVESDTKDALIPFKKVVVNQGETVFELLERLAKERGVLLTSTTNGNLKITDRRGIVTQRTTDIKNPLGFNVELAIGGSSTDLKQGQNILSATASFDSSNRFQKYLVKSQIQGDDFVNTEDATTINGSATDPAIGRPRTKYVIAEKSMDNAGAKKHAEWLANIHAVGAAELEFVVQGWTDAKGALWDINKIVGVDARFIGIPSQKMLTTGVSYNQSSQGTLCSIRVARLDSFQSQPEAENEPQKDAGWDTGIFGDTLKKVADTLGF